MADTPTLDLCCAGCGRPKHPHPNSRYCLPCRAQRRRRPLSRITPTQAALLRPLLGTMGHDALARHAGISDACFQRWLWEEGLSSNARDYPQAVCDEVTAYYAHHGRVATQAVFPEVSVRSIVERRKLRGTPYPPRQIRWTDAQLLDAARMGGLVSLTAQAHFFGRPHAFDGSISALWAKRFRCAPRDLHGLGTVLACQIMRAGAQATCVQHQSAPGFRSVILWLDLARHLRPDVPSMVRETVETLAAFQAWLYGSHDSATIRQLIADREEDSPYECANIPSNQWVADPCAADRAQHPGAV